MPTHLAVPPIARKNPDTACFLSIWAGNGQLDTVEGVVKPMLIAQSDFHKYEFAGALDEAALPVGFYPVIGAVVITPDATRVSSYSLATEESTLTSLLPNLCASMRVHERARERARTPA